MAANLCYRVLSFQLNYISGVADCCSVPVIMLVRFHFWLEFVGLFSFILVVKGDDFDKLSLHS